VPTDATEEAETDAELVTRCQGGDRASFRQLYRRYHGKVRSTLYQLCGLSNIDDLVQEVFLRAWKGLPKLKQPAHFGTWLYRISWNVASDRRQAYAKQHQKQERLIGTLPDRDRAGSPETDLMTLHYQDLVKRGLSHLSFDHRSVLVLHDLEDVPQKAIAEILQIPVGTVKSRLFHARSAMRKFLEGEGVQL
jgi:RNA polymerase sigma-70 factor (ECF subfamily)